MNELLELMEYAAKHHDFELFLMAKKRLTNLILKPSFKNDTFKRFLEVEINPGMKIMVTV